MEPELEVLLSGPVVDDGVDERHEGRLDVDVVAVLPRAPVKVVYYALQISCSIECYITTVKLCHRRYSAKGLTEVL